MGLGEGVTVGVGVKVGVNVGVGVTSLEALVQSSALQTFILPLDQYDPVPEI